MEVISLYLIIILCVSAMMYRSNQELNRLNELIKSKDEIIFRQMDLIESQCKDNRILVTNGDMITNNVDQRRI